MTLKTIVFIKQVPDTNDVKWTDDNNIDRASTESVLNPQDDAALQTALKLKEKYGANVIVATMGPKNALSVLKDAIAKGADDAILLCDSKFAGSDTCATSRVLARFVQDKFKDADLILFGQSASDGETAQTGPSVSVRLDFPFVSHVKKIIDFKDDTLTVISENDKAEDTVEIKLPCSLLIDNLSLKTEIPGVSGYMKAQDYVYTTYNLYELSLDTDVTGVKGSPTRVRKMFRAPAGRNCKFITPESPENYIDSVIDEIKKGAEK